MRGRHQLERGEHVSQIGDDRNAAAPDWLVAGVGQPAADRGSKVRMRGRFDARRVTDNVARSVDGETDNRATLHAEAPECVRIAQTRTYKGGFRTRARSSVVIDRRISHDSDIRTAGAIADWSPRGTGGRAARHCSGRGDRNDAETKQ